MVALYGLAHTAFGIRGEMRWGTGLCLACPLGRGEEGYAMVLDPAIDAFNSIKTSEATLSHLYVHLL